MTGLVIQASTSDREIVMRRTFDAPRHLVFDAWTKPELLKRWFGQAHGWTMPICEVDLRPGGSYRYVMRGPDGEEVVMRGEYREIVPPERLVTTEVFAGFSEVGWRPEDATVSTMVLTEKEGRTTWTATVVYPSKAVRDAALQSPMESGMSQSFEKLTEVLATLV
ncbi:MAG TPA: SRPBCC family protein [Candidatus Limnocylindria bacterium]|nr:SRPBCC family protein [Candidatus Limnocylindria bacterium]